MDIPYVLLQQASQFTSKNRYNYAEIDAYDKASVSLFVAYCRRANFEFSSGVIGSGLWCFSASSVSETETIEVVGDKGHIEFSSFYQKPLRLERADGLQTFEPDIPQHVHLPLVKSIVDDLLQRGTCPSTGRSGARSSWVMDEIVKGA